MKRLVSFILLIIIFYAFSGVNNHISAAEHGETILEYRHDVTGNGGRDSITLFGIPFNDDSPYFKKVWAEIELPDGKEIVIDYEGGYEPKLDFSDLNHDGVDDILYSSATGGSGGLYNYALHTIKDSKLQEIPLPAPLQIEAYFKDNFKAVINIPGLKPIKLDLKSRKADYIRMGLYQKNGKLNEPTELMIDPIAFFEIVKISDNKGYGLKSFRQISGAYHADQVGTVEVIWYYENGKWNPINIQWKGN